MSHLHSIPGRSKNLPPLRVGVGGPVGSGKTALMLQLCRKLRETMTAIEARLGTASFVRVNRSAIVQFDQIKEIQPAQHGDYTVLLRDGTKLPLSRSLRGQLDRLAGKSG